MMAGDLAFGFRQHGHDVTILTTRWEHRWSKSFLFRGIPVLRLPFSSGGPWGTFRSQRVLSNQLDPKSLDAVIVFGVSENFEAIVRLLAKTDTKVILRLGETSELTQQNMSGLSRRMVIAMQQTDMIICAHPATRQRLIQQGVDPDRSTVIPDGAFVRQDSAKTMNEQSLSRMALCDAHPILSIDSDQPLAVTGIPFNGDAGMFDLIRAWRKVARQHPKARLWLIGDGPQAKEVWHQLTEANLVYSVILPGFFDSLEDLFMAADLYLHPARSEMGHGFLVRAMAHGVCPISTDDLQGLLRDGVNGRVVSSQEPDEFAGKISEMIGASDRRRELGQAARAIALAERSFQSTIQAYLDWIHHTAPSCESIP